MDYFLLDPKTGELRTAKPLDKEALNDATGLITLDIRVSYSQHHNIARYVYSAFSCNPYSLLSMVNRPGNLWMASHNQIT